jgi:hypothetical protein
MMIIPRRMTPVANFRTSIFTRPLIPSSGDKFSPEAGDKANYALDCSSRIGPFFLDFLKR